MTDEKKKALKDILIRASKTFVQAFISALGIDSFFGVTDTKALEKVLISVLVGAVAAGISAVWNSILEWITVRIDEFDIGEFGDELAEAMGETDTEAPTETAPVTEKVGEKDDNSDTMDA